MLAKESSGKKQEKGQQVPHLWTAAPQTEETEAQIPVPNTDTLQWVQSGGHKTTVLSSIRSAPRVTQVTGYGTDQ